MNKFEVSFDLPTRLGHDSDHPLSEGVAGGTGLAVNSLEDMQTLFKDIRLEDVSPSINSNATAYILLAFYAALAKEQGADWKKLTGTIQNDILMEYAVRGAYIYPPGPSLFIATDVLEWCSQELPGWNALSLSGCPIRAAGSSAVQELAITISNGKAYVQTAIARGLDIASIGKSLSFSFSPGLEETGIRMWTQIMQEPGTADTADPGTHSLEEEAWQLIRQIDRMGGSVSAIEQGFIQEEIARSAATHMHAVPVSPIDDSIRQIQTEKLDSFRRRRDPARVDSVLQDLNDKAASGENIMPVVVEAAERRCTLGEIADTLREVFGEYK